jgi:hypothetical protein
VESERSKSARFYHYAVLKNIVDFYTLLIGAEGAKTPVGVWFRGDPAGASAEEARRNTHGKRSSWSGNQQTWYKERILNALWGILVAKHIISLIFQTMVYFR